MQSCDLAQCSLRYVHLAVTWCIYLDLPYSVKIVHVLLSLCLWRPSGRPVFLFGMYNMSSSLALNFAHKHVWACSPEFLTFWGRLAIWWEPYYKTTHTSNKTVHCISSSSMYPLVNHSKVAIFKFVIQLYKGQWLWAKNNFEELKALTLPLRLEVILVMCDITLSKWSDPLR